MSCTAHALTPAFSRFAGEGVLLARFCDLRHARTGSAFPKRDRFRKVSFAYPVRQAAGLGAKYVGDALKAGLWQHDKAVMRDRFPPLTQKMTSRHAEPGILGGRSRASIAWQSNSTRLTTDQRTKYQRERDEESTHDPAMVEPKRVDPRPLRIGSRVGNRNGIAGRQSDDRLLGRIDDAV